MMKNFKYFLPRRKDHAYKHGPPCYDADLVTRPPWKSGHSNSRELGPPSTALWGVTSLRCAGGREALSETSHASQMGLLNSIPGLSYKSRMGVGSQPGQQVIVPGVWQELPAPSTIQE